MVRIAGYLLLLDGPSERLIHCNRLDPTEAAEIERQNLGRCVENSEAARHWHKARRILLSGIILNTIGIVRIRHGATAFHLLIYDGWLLFAGVFVVAVAMDFPFVESSRPFAGYNRQRRRTLACSVRNSARNSGMPGVASFFALLLSLLTERLHCVLRGETDCTDVQHTGYVPDSTPIYGNGNALTNVMCWLAPAAHTTTY